MEEQYLTDFRIPNIIRKYIKRKLKDIRRWDLTTAKRVDVFIANSTTTQERIKRIYDHDSAVIAPPMEERFFVENSKKQKANSTPYFLAVGRMVPYKRFDLIIETANALKLPLKIAGKGHEFEKLRKLAGPTVEILGHVPDADMPSLYAGAKALIHPQFEDAGVTPLEAEATGTPVIAFAKGGAADTVKDGITGIFFAEQTVASLTAAIAKFEKMTFDRTAIRNHARQFSSERFREKMAACVENAMKKS